MKKKIPNLFQFRCCIFKDQEYITSPMKNKAKHNIIKPKIIKLHLKIVIKMGSFSSVSMVFALHIFLGLVTTLSESSSVTSIRD